MRDTTQYRARLEAMANRLGGMVKRLEDQVGTPTGGEASGGISSAPLHLADMGSEAYTQELNATLLENEAFICEEVLAALNRLDAGGYGTCERCSEAIAAARLEAIPYARHCVQCAEAVQSGLATNMNDGRPTGRNLPAENDRHAAGTPGGGGAYGGLAGTTVGSGSPNSLDLSQSSGGRESEPQDEAEEEGSFGSAKGGAVGGTPANKRSRGGRTSKSGNT